MVFFPKIRCFDRVFFPMKPHPVPIQTHSNRKNMRTHSFSTVYLIVSQDKQIIVSVNSNIYFFVLHLMIPKRYHSWRPFSGSTIFFRFSYFFSGSALFKMKKFCGRLGADLKPSFRFRNSCGHTNFSFKEETAFHPLGILFTSTNHIRVFCE